MKNIVVDGIFQILKGHYLIKLKLGYLCQPEHADFGRAGWLGFWVCETVNSCRIYCLRILFWRGESELSYGTLTSSLDPCLSSPGPNDFKLAFNLAVFPCPLFPKLKALGAKITADFLPFHHEPLSYVCCPIPLSLIHGLELARWSQWILIIWV